MVASALMNALGRRRAAGELSGFGGLGPASREASASHNSAPLPPTSN